MTIQPVAVGPSSTGNASAASGAALLLGAGLLISTLVPGTGAAHVQPLTSYRFFGGMTASARTTFDARPATPPKTLDQVPDHGSEAIRWVHDRSGLTWEQLGRIFGVSRRAVHLWANGGRMNAAHAETLARVATLVRDLQMAHPDERRAALFAPGSDGRSIMDRLVAEQSAPGGDVSGTSLKVDELLGARHGDVAR